MWQHQSRLVLRQLTSFKINASQPPWAETDFLTWSQCFQVLDIGKVWGIHCMNLES